MKKSVATKSSAKPAVKRPAPSQNTSDETKKDANQHERNEEPQVKKIKSQDINSDQSSTSNKQKQTKAFLGLRNQGATCYLNSLIQCFFHIGSFRKVSSVNLYCLTFAMAVFCIPTEQHTNPNKSIPLALQRIFYLLQRGQDSENGLPVSTRELTKSFGWSNYDSFIQHDVQELNRVLSESLEQAMRNTAVEGSIEKLFAGKTLTTIQCKNIPLKSEREEVYYDLSLNVKGMTNIYRSLDEYTADELLVGTNQYRAEGHGLQDAVKHVRFVTFPPVLFVQLKRFQYDVQADRMSKINDRFEFPEELNVSKYLVEPSKTSSHYTLAGIFVHSGDIKSGHYYLYFKVDNQWYKFNDETVTEGSLKEAIEDNFGGSISPNAYMLLYISSDSVGSILDKIPPESVPEHLEARFHKEREEEINRFKEQQASHLLATVKVAVLSDVISYTTTTEKLDLLDFEHDTVKNFRIPKATTVSQFKNMVSEAFNIPPPLQRFWSWAKRLNDTFRLDAPIMEDDTSSIGDSKSMRESNYELFLEATPQPNDHFDVNKHIFLFFKEYDPESTQLRVVGHRKLNMKDNVMDTLSAVCRDLGHFSSDTSLLVYEEVKPSLVVPLNAVHSSFEGHGMGTGDIIVFQKAPIQSEEYRLPTAVKYYDFMQNRVLLHFRRLDRPREDVCVIELSKKMLYDDVVKALAAQLEMESALLRLTGHDSFSGKPKPEPMKRQELLTLGKMLSIQATVERPTILSDLLYFEDMTTQKPLLPEGVKNANITWRNRFTLQMENTQTIIVGNDTTIAQLLQAAAEAHSIPEPNIRLFSVINSKNIVEFQNKADRRLADIQNYDVYNLYAEELEPQELNLRDPMIKVQTVHYYRTFPVIQHFGTPFIHTISTRETGKQLKDRLVEKMATIRQKLNESSHNINPVALAMCDIADCRLAWVVGAKVIYIKEDDVLQPPATQTQQQSYLPCIGIEHIKQNQIQAQYSLEASAHANKAIVINATK